jgi:hypothetical protein
MRLLPADLIHQFTALLDQKRLDGRDKATCLKWLRFYWDFCHQYHYDACRSESLPPLLDKLREKRQSDPQRNQGQQAINWLYCLQPISTVTSGVLVPSENLVDISRNPDAALRSVVLSSNTMVKNTITLPPRPPVLAQCDSKRPSQPDSYNQ